MHPSTEVRPVASGTQSHSVHVNPIANIDARGSEFDYIIYSGKHILNINILAVNLSIKLPFLLSTVK